MSGECQEGLNESYKRAGNDTNVEVTILFSRLNVHEQLTSTMQIYLCFIQTPDSGPPFLAACTNNPDEEASEECAVANAVPAQEVNNDMDLINSPCTPSASWMFHPLRCTF